jgi:exodeoxyribonuclease VII large subunit
VAEVIELGVGEFVALLNQTLEYAYPSIVVAGELANFKVWRDRLVFFDLKDDEAVINCWAYVTQLPGPLEDGMMLKVRGQPRYHPARGFRFNTQFIQPAGEGSILRAAQLLQAKLAKEGLFDESRKRLLPYPPAKIGLITAKHSAAYADFIKIINARWQGVEVELIDVQVQGEAAPAMIVHALEQFNERAETPDVLVVIRGGGSAEDLAAFNTEPVTRAVAASRVPTLVAIGHEVDLSLAELAADRRASTPSNAAELLVPDRAQILSALQEVKAQIGQLGERRLQRAKAGLQDHIVGLEQALARVFGQARGGLSSSQQLLEALNPEAILRRGYAIVRQGKKSLHSVKGLEPGAIVDVRLADGGFDARVTEVNNG